MKKLIIIMALFILSFVLVSCNDNNKTGEMWEMNWEMWEMASSDKVESKLVISKNNINLWDIPMDEWKVNIPFEITNMWNKPVVLWKSETSCMCTEWFVTDVNWWNKSGRIKMSMWWSLPLDVKKVIKPGEKMYLIGVFDPNAHWPDATWPIARDIFINTNSSATPKLDFKFFWEVIKTRGNKVVKKEENFKKSSYNPITPEQLQEMKKNKDFILVDTHTPLQKHIEGTDLVIAYNDIENNLSKLPSDKNAKIVLYCAGGWMSKVAADKLISLGYTNIYDLIWWKYNYDNYMNNK